MRMLGFVPLPVCLLGGLASLLGGCIVPKGSTPSLGYDIDAATAFVRRGMVQNERGVLQGTVRTSLPTKDEGSIGLDVFGNMDLSNDVGDAWFPGGSAGRFSETDVTASYGRTIDRFDVTVGVTSYNVPKGNLFPNGERGSTTELFVSVGTDVGGFYPALVAHYDYDEIDGLYVTGEVSKSFEVAEKLTATGTVLLGYSDADQSFWNYGVPSGQGGSGFADLVGTARLEYAWDEHTRLRFLLGASTIVDDDIRDWFDLIGIDDTVVWAAVGASWDF